jgi:hypothetical protein
MQRGVCNTISFEAVNLYVQHININTVRNVEWILKTYVGSNSELNTLFHSCIISKKLVTSV